MKIDSKILDELTAAAKASPRLRMNYDLRTTPQDGSQRMLNALEPGTVLPIHRHRTTTEVVVILRGAARQYFYDDAGNVTETITIAATSSQLSHSFDGGSCPAMIVEQSRWHRIESLESGTVILECKDGAFEPLAAEDILTVTK